MNVFNQWRKRFWKNLEQTDDKCIKNDRCIKNEYKSIIMQRLKESFDTENFEVFNEAVSTLVKKAAQKNSEAMDLLIYLKQQVNPAYRQIICLPRKLSEDIHFTRSDFERLIGLYQDQKAAQEEENSQGGNLLARIFQVSSEHIS